MQILLSGTPISCIFGFLPYYDFSRIYMRPYLMKHPDLFGTPEKEVFEDREAQFVGGFLPSLLLTLSIR